MLGDALKIWCAVCDHPVRRVSIRSEIGGHIYRAEVECHGSTETCVLTEKDLVCADKISAGTAFTKKKAIGGI